MEKSDSKKEIVTMVGKSYAKIGFKFYFKAPRTGICPKSCRYYTPCMMNLKNNAVYEIVDDLNISHNCPSDYHDEQMKLVKVVQGNLEILIETKLTFLGAVIQYDPVDCNISDCPYKEYCSPLEGIKRGTKVKIKEIIKKVKDNSCSQKSLTLVKVEKA